MPDLTILEMPIVVSSVSCHKEIQSTILDQLEQAKIDNMPFHDGNDRISKTDWNVGDSDRTHLDLVKKIIIDTITQEFKIFHPKGLAFGNFWFQQYYKNDLHDWHIHRNCHWTNIYFLELSDQKYKTEIQDFFRTDIIKYDAKEGDIITFPACLYHRSPLIDSDIRKTIISFNSNYI
jgi:hypothetical protein